MFELWSFSEAAPLFLFACFSNPRRSDDNRPILVIHVSGMKRWKENYVSEKRGDESDVVCAYARKCQRKKCRRKKKLIFVLTGARGFLCVDEHDVKYFSLPSFQIHMFRLVSDLLCLSLQFLWMSDFGWSENCRAFYNAGSASASNWQAGSIVVLLISFCWGTQNAIDRKAKVNILFTISHSIKN